MWSLGTTSTRRKPFTSGFDGSYVEYGGKTRNGEKSYFLRKWIGGVPNFLASFLKNMLRLQIYNYFPTFLHFLRNIY